MIKVQSVVECYEVDGQEVKGVISNTKHPSITIRSHWNRSDFVVLEVGDKAFTILLKDLIAAAENAANSAK
jgi:hypothetical protein